MLIRLTLLISLCLSWFLGIGQPAIALTNASPNLPQPEAVDAVLSQIPPGYYAIRSVEGLKKTIAQDGALLVDVREPTEYVKGHIKGAVNLPLRAIAHNLDQIPTDKPVIFYCSTGYRSAMGVISLHLLGYDNAQGFPPSFAGWQASGEAIERGLS